MRQVEFVVQGGGDKDGGGFRTENERAKGGGAEAGGAGTTDFGRTEVTFRANKNVESRDGALIFCVGDQGGEGAGFRLEGADDAGDGRGGIGSGQKGVEGSGLGDFRKPVLARLFAGG